MAVQAEQKPRTAAAIAAVERNAALRALDDPAKLAKAARLVRAALERGRLRHADLVGPIVRTDERGRDVAA